MCGRKKLPFLHADQREGPGGACVASKVKESDLIPAWKRQNLAPERRMEHGGSCALHLRCSRESNDQTNRRLVCGCLLNQVAHARL